MKWGNYPAKTTSFLGSKWVYYLSLVLAVAVLTGAFHKWK